MNADMVIFALHRTEDKSGTSGTGTVAYGIKFPEPNGRVTLGWVADDGLTSTAVYDSLEHVKNIHGHNGSTEIVEIDRIDCWKRE